MKLIETYRDVDLADVVWLTNPFTGGDIGRELRKWEQYAYDYKIQIDIPGWIISGEIERIETYSSI